MKKTLSLLLLSSSIMLAPLVNAEDLIDGGDPSEILEVARGFGEASLTRDDSGDPAIIGFLGDLFYAIAFYACSEEDDCDDIVLYSFLMFEEPPSLKRVNAWNQNNRIGRLDLDDEGDLALTVPIILEGGITRTNLKNIFQRYTAVYLLLERQFPEGTRMGSDDQSSSVEEPSVEPFSGNIDSELDSSLEKYVLRRSEEIGIEALLSEIADATMKSNPDGYKEDEYTYVEDIRAVGTNLFYYYEINPDMKSYFNPEAFKNEIFSRICSSKYMTQLLEEEAKIHFNYRYKNESEEFEHIVVDIQSCKNLSGQ